MLGRQLSVGLNCCSVQTSINWVALFEFYCRGKEQCCRVNPLYSHTSSRERFRSQSDRNVMLNGVYWWIIVLSCLQTHASSCRVGCCTAPASEFGVDFYGLDGGADFCKKVLMLRRACFSAMRIGGGSLFNIIRYAHDRYLDTERSLFSVYCCLWSHWLVVILYVWQSSLSSNTNVLVLDVAVWRIYVQIWKRNSSCLVNHIAGAHSTVEIWVTHNCTRAWQRL